MARRKGGINLDIFKAEVNGFVLQTSKDYDMTYHQVLKIYNKHKKGNDLSNDFYVELEEFIKLRAYKANNGIDY